jgi:hypothetical protein
MRGQKHLVPCRCVLPQFKRMTDPPNHRFVVFSVIDDNEVVVPKFVLCNNCGIAHKVFDLCRSEVIVGRESMPSALTIDDIRSSIPQNLATILETNHADLPSWEAVSFIVANKAWGEIVVLTSDTEGDSCQGKYVRIISEGLARVESFVREEVVG